MAAEPLFVNLIDHTAHRTGGIEDALAQHREAGGVRWLAAADRHHVALRGDRAQQCVKAVDLLDRDAEGEVFFLLS
ncbi:hypothetical protein FHY31_004379 [Xanthomonas euvesicatoria]|uniref:Uncharacterized protein n=1 Tax=Xanthomonas euvesicatoria TaxID=456327 RepID=A0AAW3UBS3_XANEU|nr:hypothetical protein [Xanthomonas euvesicatoria]MBB4872558.1 hypothetical protein [Xanthomonas euvesicatoria]